MARSERLRQQKAATASMRHGRPKREYIASLKKARKADYTALAKACITILSECSSGIDLIVPHIAKFEKGFPKGRVVGYDGMNDIRQINANRLLDWLYDNGHSAVSAQHVDRIRRKVAELFKD